jgi:hypothetical protein
MALTRVTTGVIETNTILGQDISDGTVSLDKLDISGAQPGDAIVFTSGGALAYQPVNLDNIGDVSTSGADIGDALVWNGTGWAPGTPVGGGSGGSGIDTLDELLDVSLTPLSAGQYLKWNGSVWTNDVIDYSEIANTPFIPLNFGDLGDVTLTGPVANQVAVFDGTNWVNLAVTKSLISDFNDADYATQAQGALADTALQGGENISIFANDAGYLTAGTAVGAIGLEPVALSGSYNDLTDVPTEFNPTVHAHVKADITDFDDADYATSAQGALADTALQGGENISIFANDAGYLTSATGGASLGLAPVATSGDYADLTNIPSTFAPSAHTHVKAQITDFSDSDYATAAQGALATSAVQPGDLSTVATTGDYNDLANIPATATPSAHTHTKSDITDFDDADYATAIQGLKADTALQSGDVATLALSGLWGDIIGKPTTFTPDAHTHLKADITDFNDADYASAAQGVLANTAVQPGENISIFANDEGFLSTNIAGSLPGQFVYFDGTDWTNKTLAKSDISNFDDSDYATSAQGVLATTALQPGDNVSDLVNDAGYFSDVAVNTGTLSSGDALLFDGTIWRNRPIELADIVDYDGNIYATAAQGALADSSLQPGSDVSVLTNNVGYLTGDSILNDLLDVIAVTPDAGDVLRWDGSEWVNSPDSIDTLTLDDVTDVDVSGAVPGQILTFDGTGWIASGANGGTGETNTASNIGPGEGIFATKTGVDLEFKSILAGSGVSVTDFGNNLTLALDAGLSNLDDVDTSGAVANQILRFNGTEWVASTESPTAGEANTFSSRPGTGEEVIASKIGVDLQFKRLRASGNIVLSSDGNEITIGTASNVGEANTASNVGTGAGLFLQKTGTDLEFKTLLAGPNVTLTQGATEVQIESFNPLESVSNLQEGDGLIYESGAWNNRPLLKADISNFSDADYATAAQGALADSAAQPGDSISIFDNDTGYLTGSSILNDLLDVDVDGNPDPLVAGQILRWNGVQWVNDNESTDLTASNLGDGEDVFFQKNVNDLEFRTIKAGSGINITVNGNNALEIESTASGAGEANTASNRGAGEGVFFQKTGADLEFKSLIAGANITLSSDDDGITIESTGGGSASELDDLTDVTIVGTPAANNVLFHNGSVWRNGTILEAGLATAAQGALAESALQNINSESITELLDVDTTGATTNDVLTFNGTSWVPGAPATGGIDWTVDQNGSAVIHPGNYTNTDAFADLTDVDLGGGAIALAPGQIPVYNGINWVNTGGVSSFDGTATYLTYNTPAVGEVLVTASVSGSNVIMQNQAFTLENLTDTDNTGTAADGEVLTWIAANNKWEPQAVSGNQFPDPLDAYEYIVGGEQGGEDNGWDIRDVRELPRRRKDFQVSRSVEDTDINALLIAEGAGAKTYTLDELNFPGFEGTDFYQITMHNRGVDPVTITSGLNAEVISPNGRAPVLNQGETVTISRISLGGFDRWVLDFSTQTINDLVGTQNLSTAADGQVIAWNQTAGLWEPQTVSAGGGGVTELTALNDTIGTAVANGFLRWNAGGTTVEYVSIVKADITDFNDADYATAAQGALADTALQSGANISLLTNDAGYLTTAIQQNDNISLLTNDAGYITSAPSVIDDLGDVDTTSVVPNNGEVLGWDGSNWVPTAVSSGVTNLTWNPATQSVNSDTGTDAVIPNVLPAGTSGLMSGADKTKLDNIQDGAEINQNAFTSVALTGNVTGDASIDADAKTDTLNIVAGTNVSIVGDGSTDTITINAAPGGGATNLSTTNVTATNVDVASDTGTDATLPAVTTTTAGLMTASDKTALDGLAGAEANQNAFSNFALTGNTAGDTTISADTPTDSVTLVGGSNVTLTGNAAGDQIIIDAAGGGAGGGAQTEDLVVRYTSGSGGTLNAGDVIVSTTSGISATVVDGANSIVEISFTGYNLPPASIVAYGQNYSSNVWSIKGLGSLVASASQTVNDTGSAANPDILNTGVACPPIRLQIRMSDTGSSAGFGQRAQALIRLVMLG